MKVKSIFEAPQTTGFRKFAKCRMRTQNEANIVGICQNEYGTMAYMG